MSVLLRFSILIYLMDNIIFGSKNVKVDNMLLGALKYYAGTFLSFFDHLPLCNQMSANDRPPEFNTNKNKNQAQNEMKLRTGIEYN